MQLEDKHYLVCPELFESYRNESLISETAGDSFKILCYNKGRIELHYGECINIELPGVASLTHYQNGDYKLTTN